MSVSYNTGFLLPKNKKLRSKTTELSAVENLNTDEQFFRSAITIWGFICCCIGVLLLPVSLLLMAAKRLRGFTKVLAVSGAQPGLPPPIRTSNSRAGLHKKEDAPLKKTIDSRKDIYAVLLHLIVLALIFLPVYINILDEKIDVNGDNIFYHLLGKALASGRGYVNIYSPSVEPHNHFPPGYPFIISLFMRIGFTEISFFSYLNGFLTFCSILLLYFYISKLTDNKRLAFVVSLLTCLNTSILGYARINMSEIPFMFFSILSLFSLAYGNKKDTPLKDPFFLLTLLGIIAACYIRTAGIALFAAVLIQYALHRQWKHVLLLCLLFTAAMLPWQLRSLHLGGNSYMQQLTMINPYHQELGKASFNDYLIRVWDNLSRYISVEIPVAILPGQFIYPAPKTHIPATNWITGLILVSASLYSLIKLFKKQVALTLYVLFAGCILLLWPSVWKGVRFMLPVVPLILFFLLYFINAAFNAALHKISFSWNPVILATLTILMVNPIRAMQDETEDPYSPGYKNYFDIAIWAKTHLPEDAIVCCRKTELFYIFAEKRSIQYLQSTDPDEVYTNLCTSGATYVVMDQLGFSSTSRCLLPAINKHAVNFEIVHHIPNPDTYLLKLHR